MKKLVGFIGATVVGYAGWYLGAPFGFMTAFIVSIIGSGLGIYLAHRILDHYLS